MNRSAMFHLKVQTTGIQGPKITQYKMQTDRGREEEAQRTKLYLGQLIIEDRKLSELESQE